MGQKKSTLLRALLLLLVTLLPALGNGLAEEVRPISMEELTTMLDSGEKIMLLNPETELLFNEGHIPGSVNIPLKELSGRDALPADRETVIVIYCRGPKSVAGRQAAELVSEKGYSHVRWFAEGAAAWAAKGYGLEYHKALPRIPVSSVNPVQLQESLPDVVVLDIRPPWLQDLGWIKGSHKMPLEELSEKYMDLPKGRKIVVVDHTGNQAILAARFLEQKGYAVQGLVGGMAAWVNEGLPVEK